MRKFGSRILLFVVALLLFVVTSCNQQDASIHLTMGNPSQATAQISNADNYLMRKQGYALSYNSSKGIPNWISWQLNRDWLGGLQRQNDFRPDPDLPSEWYSVKPFDYNRTGYDKGHMAPSGDRTKDAAINSETFLMTNIVPQARDNNRGTWRVLEEYSRGLVKAGKELYIISGGIGEKKKLAKGKVSVPDRVWKIVVVLDRPGQGVSGVNVNTRAIAVDMPNENKIAPDWRKYLTTIDRLESETGYDFLSNVSESIQQSIESRVDDETSSAIDRGNIDRQIR